MNKKLIAALFAGAFAFASATAIADDKTPSAPVDQAKLKADRAEAKAKYDKMTPEERASMRKAAQAKKVMDLSTLEIIAQEGDNNAAVTADASAKADRDAARAKWAQMTPEERAAMRKAAAPKKLSELSTLERMSVGQ